MVSSVIGMAPAAAATKDPPLTFHMIAVVKPAVHIIVSRRNITNNVVTCTTKSHLRMRHEFNARAPNCFTHTDLFYTLLGLKEAILNNPRQLINTCQCYRNPASVLVGHPLNKFLCILICKARQMERRLNRF